MTNLSGTNLNRSEAAGPKGEGRDSSSKFPRYPEYKNSGVEWLGEIPVHWKVSRLGFESWIRARLGWKGLKADEYVEEGYIFLSTPNIKGRSIDFDNVNYISKHRFHESPEIILREGDVLLAKDGSTLGTVNLVHCIPRPATVNSSIAVITPYERLDGLFLKYIFESNFMINTIQAIKGGMGVPHLFQADLNKFYLPVPSRKEQSAITTFLDHETARIDALVEEQKRLIELLKEKRQAVISHSVTMGLDPDVPMKDSGVEWLGNIPLHWERVSIKRVISIRYGIGEPPAYRDSGTPLIRATNVSRGSIDDEGMVFVNPEDIPEKRIVWLQHGDIIVVRSGAYTGDSAIVQQSHLPAIAGFDMVARPIGCFPKFLQYSLLSQYLKDNQIDLEKLRAAQPHLNAEELGACFILLPPAEEQKAIVAFLNDKIAQIDSLVETAKAGVTLLKERRSALISAAVTGKIDVRDWQPPSQSATREEAISQEVV